MSSSLRLLTLLCCALTLSCKASVSRFASQGAPSQLHYAQNPATYLRGQSIEPNLATVSGTVESFSVAPALPAGLSLDASTGTISGTPIAVSSVSEYVITASNSQGLTSARLSVVVNDRAPQDLSYPENPARYVRGVAVTANTPTTNAGIATEFVSSPALPPGLLLDPVLGTLSGTPLISVPAADYVITARNAFGAAHASLQIEVVEPPPVLTFFRAPYVFVEDEAASTGAPLNNGGPFASCSIASSSQPLPEGLEINPETCEIFGFPSDPKPTTEYTLSVIHDTGEANPTVTITVSGPLAVYPPTATVTASRTDRVPLTPEGGVPPYRYTLLSGEGDIDATTGDFLVPNVPGTSIVRVQDSQGRTVFSQIVSERIVANGEVKAFARDAAGSLWFGGLFSAIAPYARQNLAALDANSGQVALALDIQSGFNGPVHSVVAQDDFIYVGGSFSTYRGLPARSLAKIDRHTGILDWTFTRAVGFDDVVYALALDAERLIVGGDFHAYRGNPDANLLAVLNVDDGDLIASVHASGAIISTGSTVRAIAVTPDAYVVGGFFQKARGQDVSNLVKLDKQDGQLSDGFSLIGANSTVHALAVSTTAVYLGGEFSQYGGVDATRLAKASLTDGTADGQFARATGYGGGAITSLVLRPTLLFAAGGVNKYDNFDVGKLIAVHPDSGLLDTMVADSVGFAGQSVGIHCLLDSGDGVFVGGTFAKYRGVNVSNGLVKLKDSGELDEAFALTEGVARGAPNPETVLAMARVDDTVVIGGDFWFIGGTPAKNIARVDEDTFVPDASFVDADAFDGAVNAIAASGDAIIVGGNFQNYTHQGVIKAAPRIVRFNADASFDETFGVPNGFDGAVNAIVASASAIHVGGAFTMYGVTSTSRLVTLKPSDGSIERAETVGFDNTVRALALDERGASADWLYVGGDFTNYQATSINRLVRVQINTGSDNSLSGAFVGGSQGVTSLNATVQAIALVTTGSSAVVVGGNFSSYAWGGVSAGNANNSVARHLLILDSDGSPHPYWAAANGPNAEVTSLSVFNSNTRTRVYVGGAFSRYAYGGEDRNASALFALDGSTYAPLDGFNTTPAVTAGSVSTLFTTGARLLVGGTLTSYRNALAGHALVLDLENGVPFY